MLVLIIYYMTVNILFLFVILIQNMLKHEAQTEGLLLKVC